MRELFVLGLLASMLPKERKGMPVWPFVLTLIGFVGMTAAAIHHKSNADTYRNLFEADRACRPGMVLEVLDNKRALCVGGQKETWVRNYLP